MRTDVSPQFEDEIRSFWILSISNLVFAAITMAYGIMFIVTRLQEMAQAGSLLLMPLIMVIVGFAVAGTRYKVDTGKRGDFQQYRGVEIRV